MASERDYKDWGFDAVYPALPPRPDPFEQVRTWDREHPGRWIERSNELRGLAAISSAMKDNYLHMMRAQLNARALFWTSTVITTGSKMQSDMRQYRDTADPFVRVKKIVKRWRSSWRTNLALKLAPHLQEECY